MKKVLYLVLFFLISSVRAQELETSKFTYGVTGGVSAGAPVPQKFEPNEDGELGVGPLLGAWVRYHISPKILLEGQIYYDSRGKSTYSKQYRRDTIVTTTIGGVTGQIPTFYNAFVNGNLKLRYLTLPVSASYKIKKWLSAHLGTQINYLTKASDVGTAKVVVGEGGIVDDVFRDYENASDIQKWDYGVNGGVSFFLFPEFEVQLRYFKGLNSIYRPGFFSDNKQTERKFLNSKLQVSIQYQLGKL